MKRTLLLAALLMLAAGSLRAQSEGDTTASKKGLFSGTWTTSSTPALKVDENFYSNWAATGISQVAFVGTFNGDYKYTHQKFIWDNVADLALGVYWQNLIHKDTIDPATGKPYPFFDTRRKNDDKIDLTSTYSQKLKNAWNVNASVNLKSQFMDGFTYVSPVDTGTLVSSFMAPGYLTTAIGFECKKDDWNVSLSFLTGKSTFVMDERVIEAGQLYGVDTTGGKRSYFGLGSYVKFYYKKDIAKDLNLYLRMELFYDYRKPTYHDRIFEADLERYAGLTPEEQATFEPTFGSWEDIDEGLYDADPMTRIRKTMRYDTDIDFEMKLEYRFSNFLSAYLTTRFKYDSDYKPLENLFGGEKETPWQFYQGAGVQIYFNWKTPHEKKS